MESFALSVRQRLVLTATRVTGFHDATGVQKHHFQLTFAIATTRDCASTFYLATFAIRAAAASLVRAALARTATETQHGRTSRAARRCSM